MGAAWGWLVALIGIRAASTNAGAIPISLQRYTSVAGLLIWQHYTRQSLLSVCEGS
ncbi:hypothetical protein GL286_21860 [Paracoccus aestuariivivens]|uniref:Uncharacterized protein n=2 Tax=Paracoccus aestuariivivens TaxID=1820333 RepID=A0A6L6JGK1_9RHOB|nr:hypothetical protein [Paracoccus aestuariivivens]